MADGYAAFLAGARLEQLANQYVADAEDARSIAWGIVGDLSVDAKFRPSRRQIVLTFTLPDDAPEPTEAEIAGPDA